MSQIPAWPPRRSGRSRSRSPKPGVNSPNGREEELRWGSTGPLSRFSWGRDSFLESKEYQLGGCGAKTYQDSRLLLFVFSFLVIIHLTCIRACFFLISGACVEFVNDVCWFLDPWPSDVSSFIAIEGEWCEQFLAKECVGVYYRDHSFMVPIHLPKAALHITMAVLPRWWIPPSWSGEGGGWR